MSCVSSVPGSSLSPRLAAVSQSACSHWEPGHPKLRVYFPSETHGWLGVWKTAAWLEREYVRERAVTSRRPAGDLECPFRRLFNKLCLYLPWWGTHLPGTAQGCLASRLPFLGLRSSWWQWLPAGPWESPVEHWPAYSFVPVNLVPLHAWPGCLW